jgi:GTPase SAR1 family protein
MSAILNAEPVMNVVIIGDRAVGKTSIVAALAEYSLDRDSKVKIISPDPHTLLRDLRPETGKGAGTANQSERELTMRVQRPNGASKEINVGWIDLPGEFFHEHSNYRERGGVDWQDIQAKIERSKYVILLIPPYRTLVEATRLDQAPEALRPETVLPNQEQWHKRLSAWFDFLNRYCARSSRILICIHKADLFCDLDQVSREWSYLPGQISTDFWRRYHEFSKSFLRGMQQSVKAYSQTNAGTNTNFFITSIVHRELLALPWLYIGLYL